MSENQERGVLDLCVRLCKAVSFRTVRRDTHTHTHSIVALSMCLRRCSLSSLRVLVTVAVALNRMQDGCFETGVTAQLAGLFCTDTQSYNSAAWAIPQHERPTRTPLRLHSGQVCLCLPRLSVLHQCNHKHDIINETWRHSVFQVLHVGIALYVCKTLKHHWIGADLSE